MRPPRAAAAGRPALVLGTLGLAVVAFGFQQTAVIPALPTVQHDLRTTEAWSAWLQTGYLISACILTPLIGTLGDRRGKRRWLVISLALFLAGSIGAAVAPSIGWLIACRVLQGGGGAVFPLALAISRDELPAERVPGAIGLLTGAFGLGTALGFAGGGALVELLGWRWVFVAGAAALTVATALTVLRVPESPVRRGGRLDAVGAVLLAGGLGGILLAITEGPTAGWDAPWTVAGLVGGAALLAGYAAWDLRVDHPLLDLRVFGRRTVLLANLSTIGLGFAMFGSYLLVPYLVQGAGGAAGFAAGPLTAGLHLLPAALGELVGGPLAPRLARRLSAKWVYVLGLALVTAGAAGFALAHDRAVLLVCWAWLLGSGVGLAIGIASSIVAHAVERSHTGIATSLNSVVRRVGGALGGQVAAVLLAGVAVAGGPPAGALATAFWVCAGAGAVAALLALGIRRDDA